jgi:hypothetical protein
MGCCVELTKAYKLIKNLYGLKDAGKAWADYSTVSNKRPIEAVYRVLE